LGRRNYNPVGPRFKGSRRKNRGRSRPRRPARPRAVWPPRTAR
jgi:hypothetical protein